MCECGERCVCVCVCVVSVVSVCGECCQCVCVVSVCVVSVVSECVWHRVTSLIRNRHPVGPYSRTMPGLLWCSSGGGGVLMSDPCTRQALVARQTQKRQKAPPTIPTSTGTRSPPRSPYTQQSPDELCKRARFLVAAYSRLLESSGENGAVAHHSLDAAVSQQWGGTAPCIENASRLGACSMPLGSSGEARHLLWDPLHYTCRRRLR